MVMNSLAPDHAVIKDLDGLLELLGHIKAYW